MFTKLQSVLANVSNKHLIAAGFSCATIGGFGLGYISGRIHGRKKAAVVVVDEAISAEAEAPNATATEE
nr:MAG: hypothetical protein [Bacteriophage sp.]